VNLFSISLYIWESVWLIRSFTIDVHADPLIVYNEQSTLKASSGEE